MTILTRRRLLTRAACGFGALALHGLLGESARAADPAVIAPGIAAGGGIGAHQAARAKRIIFIYLRGGLSHMDTFDYKPRLQADDGKELPFALPKLQQAQKRNLGKLLGSPWPFARHGQSGLWISSLFPHLARYADDLCMLNGMHTDGVDHGQATIRLHTGADTFVRPSLGSWLMYGLGTENRDLPGFVTICPLRGDQGTRGFSNAFLPSDTQGTPLGIEGVPVRQAAFRNLVNADLGTDLQRRRLDHVQTMNRAHQVTAAEDARLEGVIRSYELAFRMQAAAPPVLDLDRETPATKAMYGIGVEPTDDFGRQCLMARRLSEAGVRYVQVTHTSPGGEFPGWDQHNHLKPGHESNAAQVDQPIAGLLADLKGRGLLEDTLVLCGSEFGRTPVTEGRAGSFGRDHNPYGFTVWLAGGGVKGGFVHGATDDYGYYAVAGKVHMHDLHATLLHLMGLDHERLTYRYAGRDFRLTDVYGEVVKEILA